MNTIKIRDSEDPKISDLKPCPLCGSDDLNIKNYGIECYNCGLWLGEGTQVMRLGGKEKVWNTRAVLCRNCGAVIGTGKSYRTLCNDCQCR